MDKQLNSGIKEITLSLTLSLEDIECINNIPDQLDKSGIIDHIKTLIKSKIDLTD